MGSLMAGWASPVKNPKEVKYQRNRSLTREEIDTYWKSKKKKEEDHVLNKVVSEEISKESGKIYKKSSSMPLVNNTTRSFLDMENGDHNESLEKLLLKNGWWTSSSSAFLNEPPVIEEESNRSHDKYTSQFHVTSFNVSKTNGHVGISA